MFKKIWNWFKSLFTNDVQEIDVARSNYQPRVVDLRSQYYFRNGKFYYAETGMEVFDLVLLSELKIAFMDEVNSYDDSLNVYSSIELPINETPVNDDINEVNRQIDVQVQSSKSPLEVETYTPPVYETTTSEPETKQPTSSVPTYEPSSYEPSSYESSSYESSSSSDTYSSSD